MPGADSTLATAINNAEQIVGVYTISGQPTFHSFLLKGGRYHDIDVPGSTITSTLGINDAGQMVGTFVAAGAQHGFLLSGGSYTTLDVPGSSYTIASGINGLGEIVGVYGDPSGIRHGFVRTGGSYTTFDLPASLDTNSDIVNGINNAGQIVGSYLVNEGGLRRHGFLATPNTPVSAFAWYGPAPIFAGVTGNPSFVQAIPGTYGSKGNYELIVPLQSGGLAHFYRDNDDPTLPWYGPFPFATDQGIVEAVSLIQSNFSSAGNGPGNLAVVARTGQQLDYFYRDDVHFAWHGPFPITSGVTGVPSFVQARPGTYGTKGNYELVTPLASGGMAHFYRDNDDPNVPWTETATFGTDLGAIDAVSLIQSNFCTQFVQSGVQGPGNLALVARAGSTLYYFYRDDVAPFTWHGPTMTVATGVTGNPSLVQARPGTYGTMGNYELVVPLLSGGIAHFYRNNDDPNLPWTMTATFGMSPGTVEGVSLVQSNFSTAGNGPGNLGVVSVANNRADYFYRDDK